MAFSPIPDSNGATYRNNVNVDLTAIGAIDGQTASYTLQPSDDMKFVDINSASACNVSIPNTLSAGFSATVTQMGAGRVTFVGTGGMAINEPDSKLNTAKQYAAVTVRVEATNVAILGGYTA